MIWSILLSTIAVISGIFIIVFTIRKPQLFWPFLIVISVGTAGLMIKGYALIDEFLLACLLFGVLLSGSFEISRLKRENRLFLFHKCLFFLLIIYLFFQSWRGLLLWQDLKIARWIVFYLLVALLAFVLFKKPFSSFDSKKTSLIVLITALIYFGLYLFHGLFAEIVRGVSRFNLQGREWSGSSYAVFPLIIALPVAISLFKKRNFIFRILSIGFLALSTIITFYYYSRFALLIILVFLFSSFFILGLRKSLILILVFSVFTGFIFSFEKVGIVKYAESYYKMLKRHATEFYKPEGNDVGRYIYFRASLKAVNENLVTFLFGYGYYSHRRVLAPYLQELYNQYLPGQTVGGIIRTPSFSAWLVDTGWIGIGLLLLNLLILSLIIVAQRRNPDRFILLLVLPLLIFWMLANEGFDIVLFFLLIMPSGLIIQLCQGQKKEEVFSEENSINKIKLFSRKWPFLHRFLQNIYHSSRQILETYLFGSKLQELIWKGRRQEWARAYLESTSHPHRRLLIKKISTYAPFEKILEIGAASGPNLILLAKKFPRAKIRGIDINSKAVKIGNEYFAKNGISNVRLLTGKADKLQFPNKSFDIIFTDAALIYIGPDKIKKVALEMKRVAKKAMILAEHHSETSSASGIYNKGNWLRDYKKLFKPFSSQIKITKIPPEIWGEDWAKLGYIIEIILIQDYV